jgi:AcrR family transcriptional regulator
MAAHALSPEQRRQIEDIVLDLTAQQGFDGWRISDVVNRSGISSRTLYKYYPSKEYLVLNAFTERARVTMEPLFEGARVKGRTPRSRVLKLIGTLTDFLTASPVSSRALVHTLVCGQEAVVPLLQTFDETMRMLIGRALAGGEPGDPEWAKAEMIQQVWFAAIIAWSSNIQPAEYIEESVARVLRLLDVNH